MEKTYKKDCPICGDEMVYTRKDSLKDSIDKNRKCRPCSKKGVKPAYYIDGKIPDEILVKMSKTWFKKGDRPKNADMRKNKTYEEIYGPEKAKKVKKKLSEYIQPEEINKKRCKTMIRVWENGDLDHLRTRVVSEETKIKHRVNFIKKLKLTDKNFHPPFNIKACEYFNDIMNKENIIIQHALNGGEYHIEELGFWIDGYDIENNVVYEYDEKQHFDKHGNLKEKDVLRQQLITEHLKCKFIRIKEDTLS